MLGDGLRVCLVGFGLGHGPKPYEFIGFGDIHGPKPYEFIGFGDIHGPALKQGHNLGKDHSKKEAAKRTFDFAIVA
jgi:hypothetical protein